MENVKRYVGCCGAYCKTCKPHIDGLCKGCKLGYESGDRDIDMAKCMIKLCCFRDNKLETCADCLKIDTCSTIDSFYSHKGHKYVKYRQSVEYIRENGYNEFIKHANKWNGPYGKLD